MQEAISIKLKVAREECLLSQNEVATQLNISRQAVSRWETGKAYPDIDNLVLLSKLYHLSLDELLETNQKNNSQTEVLPTSDTHLLFHDLDCVISVLSILAVILIPFVMFHG